MPDESHRKRLPTPADAVVVRVLDDGSEQTWPLEHELVIGRTRGDVVIPDDPFLSSQHAAIRREDGGWVLRDLGSTNGTFARVRSEIELRPGDHVLIGSQVFRFLL